MGNQNSSKSNHVHPPVNWTHSFPRDNRRLKKYGATAENKVLPQRIPGQRLRPTENGHILQTKGTISGRRINEFQAPHHPAFPPPMPLHHQHQGIQHPHSASMTALHYPHHQDERASSIHDLRFGRPPSKNYASEPDLRGSSSPSVAPINMPHTIISQSPTKGRIKSKKKYKAPPVPQGEMNTSHSLPRGAMRSQSVSDMAAPMHHAHGQTQCAVHFADNIDQEITSSPEAQKQKTRKIGLFRKKNESRRPSSGEDQRSSGEEQERGRSATEIRRSGGVSPVRYSPRDELRERARSLDCLQHELRHSPVSPVPTAATSMTHLHHPQEPRMWSTLERDSRRSARQEVESRRSSTLERESRRSVTDSKRITTLEREVQKSHRRMSTLERKVEERKQWASEGYDNSTPPSSSRVSRLDSYRDGSSHRRSSSSGSHPEVIQEEIKKKEDDRSKMEKEKMKLNKKNSTKNISDEWDKEAEIQKNNNRKLSPSLQAELIHTVNNLRKSSTEQEHKSSTLTRKGKESERWPSKPISNHSEDVVPMESQPKTFFFGMEPEVSRDPRSETNTGLHKIKNQEEVSKARNLEEVHINGQTVEFSRRTLERAERSQSRNRSTRKENQKTSEMSSSVINLESGKHASHRKISKDVEDFAVAIERYKMSRLDGESGASGSSRREDGGYHSRQNSGSLYLDNESDGREEGGLCMNLRPILPRRQLEIPRFSPNAAWRSLSLERSGRHTETHEETQSSEGPDSVFESKIQRFTRPTAPPRGSGEKSADSGISGDAGSPGPTHEFEPLMPTEKTKSSSGPLAVSSPVVSGRAEGRRAWTPAQDLDENSLDSNGEPADIPTGLSTPPKLTSRSNMFPKTKELPPEAEIELESPAETETISELISPDDKDHWSKSKKFNGAVVHPQKFNSLRKLKRSVSGAVTGVGHKNYGPEDYHRSKTPDQPRGLQQGDDSHWRDNWSMSRSIPNSLNTCEEQDTVSNLSSTRNIKSRSESRIGLNGDTHPEDSRSRTPSYLMYGNGGHIMYLPEYNSRRMSHGAVGSEDEVDHCLHRSPHRKDGRYVSQYSALPSSPENERKPPSGDEDPALPESYNGSASIPATAVAPPPRKLKGKKFSYQSTVRILEMRKLEEKLTREVAEKEKQRIKEMEAMKKVEEEFQRKREREKKKVKQQLKLFHMQQQQQQNLQQSQQHTTRETHNNSYSSDDHPPSSYSSEQHEVSSQASSQPPPLPRSPPPQVCSSFASLPPELPTETCSGLISGIKSWVKNRKESRSSTSSTTLTSGSRQEPDGAPASSPRKTSDDYRTSGSSSPKNSLPSSDQVKQDIRAEIIAASKKRNGDVIGRQDKQPSGKVSPQQKSVSIHTNMTAKQEPQHSQSNPHDVSLHHQHHQKLSKHHMKEDVRHSQSADKRRLGSGLMQELSELHQERREYREYRSPSRHSRHSQSPPAGTPGSPLVPMSAMKASNNYRRDFCRGNAQVIGLNVVAVKGRRSDESDRYSKHSSEDRRSVSSGGIQRSASVDFLETGSCSSSTGSPSNQPSGHPADPSLSHNYGRGGGYPPVDSSPARFAHSILTPFNPVKGYRPVSFTPPPPTKILPVN